MSSWMVDSDEEHRVKVALFLDVWQHGERSNADRHVRDYWVRWVYSASPEALTNFFKYI
jgi:hypothetical protein